MLALNLELGLLALVIKPHSRVKKPMWLVAVILGALLAQKKIAGKLETAVALEKKKNHPPAALNTLQSRESWRTFVYTNSSNADMTFQVFINKL